jgi:hypothetical protein
MLTCPDLHSIVPCYGTLRGDAMLLGMQYVSLLLFQKVFRFFFSFSFKINHKRRYHVVLFNGIVSHNFPINNSMLKHLKVLSGYQVNLSVLILFLSGNKQILTVATNLTISVNGLSYLIAYSVNSKNM